MDSPRICALGCSTYTKQYCSMLCVAERRCVPARALAARGAAGGVWQRVRARHHAAQPRWARRHLLLAHNLLYAYRTPEVFVILIMI